jgi:hypothetical protein
VRRGWATAKFGIQPVLNKVYFSNEVDHGPAMSDGEAAKDDSKLEQKPEQKPEGRVIDGEVADKDRRPV